MGELEKAGINTTVRWSKGIDVNAACGQLRSQHERAVENQKKWVYLI